MYGVFSAGQWHRGDGVICMVFLQQANGTEEMTCMVFLLQASGIEEMV